MHNFKWWEKLLMILLVPLFVVSYFLVFVTSVKPLEENPVFFFIGTVFAAISIASFFGLLKLVRKYYDYHSRKGAYWFFGTIIVVPLVSACAVLFYHQKWTCILEIIGLAIVFAYFVCREFGRFNIKINKLSKIHVGDLKSFNTDLQVIGKNKKVKSSSDLVKTGDIIIIKKDSETILTLEVLKNQKEQ